MTDECLSCGFCREVVDAHFSKSEYAEWKQRRASVTLQVVDIQRFPVAPSPHQVCRFYVAASDGAALSWIVIPPRTEIEETIAQYQLDIGCPITMHEFALLPAANGRNVVVPLRLSFSPNPVPLIGTPHVDKSLFTLSPKSLCGNLAASRELEELETAMLHNFTVVTLQEILSSPGCVLSPWQIEVRIVSSVITMRVGAGMAEGLPFSSSRSRNWSTLKCIVVDRNGHAITTLFCGNPSWLERFTPCSMWRLASGNVVWEQTMEAIPSHLCYTEQSRCYPLAEWAEATSTGAKCRFPLPRCPVSVVSDLAQALPSITEIIDTIPLDRVVSVIGVVVSYRPGVLTHTKRGSTIRANVVLADPRQRMSMIDLTLWGETWSGIEFEKNARFWVHNVTVRQFQQQKNLSSRGDSVFLRLSDELSFPPAVEAMLDTNMAGGVSPEEGAPDPSSSVLFVLQLSESTEILPALARIHEIGSPFLVQKCRACRQTISMEDGPLRCPYCGTEEITHEFLLRLSLSDGEEEIDVMCLNSAGENLFEITAEEFYLQKQRHQQASTLSLESQISSHLVGWPVLVWLLRTGSDSPAVLANCRHIDFGTCCAALLSAIEASIPTLLDGDDGVCEL